MVQLMNSPEHLKKNNAKETLNLPENRRRTNIPYSFYEANITVIPKAGRHYK